MTEFSDHVEAYLRQERQWPRLHRINHAKMLLTKAYEEDNLAKVFFFKAVLKRLEES